jgi:hypothetical protein
LEIKLDKNFQGPKSNDWIEIETTIVGSEQPNQDLILVTLLVPSNEPATWPAVGRATTRATKLAIGPTSSHAAGRAARPMKIIDHKLFDNSKIKTSAKLWKDYPTLMGLFEKLAMHSLN